ncbi:hypothetical protein H0H92_004586 [Tricholoma furcatifolium]|nr:hypothetical protein H0H92_004586 [Tricholoma furcatifolium]
MSVTCTVVVGQGSGQYWGTLVASNFSGSVQSYLYMEFNSPYPVEDNGFNFANVPWPTTVTSSVIANQNLGSSTYLVQVRFVFSQPYTFTGGEQLTIGVGGDLTQDPEKWTSSFVLSADPAGTVDIQCAAAPDPGLVGYQQELTFTQGALVVVVALTPGSSSSIQLIPGTYTVTAAELDNEDQTIVAPAQVSSSTVTVVLNQTTDLSVTYGTVAYYSALQVVISDIDPLQKLGAPFHVTAKTSDQTIADFWSPNNYTTTLPRLPSSGTVTVSVEAIALNDIGYLFNPQTVQLSGTVQTVTFSQYDDTEPIDTTGFVTLPIVVQTTNPSNATLTVRLVRTNQANLAYAQEVVAQAGTTNFEVLVAPTQYTVDVSNFISDFTVYVVSSPSTLTVAADGSTTLPLSIDTGANLKVAGFPDFLSFGGCSDLPVNDTDVPDFVRARASSIFKYAGTDGAGDPAQYLPQDLATVNTIKRAAAVQAGLPGQDVLPVMISYTCNFSGGGVSKFDTSSWPTEAAHSFGNLIQSLLDANTTIAANPAIRGIGFVVNPDFIGECEKNKLTASKVVRVRGPLQDALDYRRDHDNHPDIPQDIPDTIDDTLAGYILAVNWIMRAIPSALSFSFTVTFGWQVNLWGDPTTDGAKWIYNSSIDPATVAGNMAAYIQSLSVYGNADYCPDFLAIDRYERDDFVSECYLNGYCFGSYEWPRFFDFCEQLSEKLKVPVMPWQIPSSHTPLTSDSVADNLDPQHWGTGGSYVLGDTQLNTSIQNINRAILALDFHGLVWTYATAEEMFKRVAFDWSKPAYRDFPLRGIFAVLLGGGSTTGIASDIGNAVPFVTDRLHDYMENPISLENTPPSV